MDYKLFILVILSLLVVSCAPKVTVYKDGYPLPKNTYHNTNIQTHMEVFANVGKYYYKNKEEEKYLYPEWLDVGKKYGNFEDKIKYIGGYLKIINPDEVEYTVELVHKRKVYNEEKSSYYMKKNGTCLYSGSIPRKVIEIRKLYERNTKNDEIIIKVYKSEKRGLQNKLFHVRYIKYNVEDV